MNVIVSNKYRNELRNIGIDISGVLEGEYTSDQIVNAFSNYYYEKIILDVTAIKDYNNISNLLTELKKIFSILDPNKSIILFENSPVFNNDVVFSNLVSNKIYNYAFDLPGVIELFNNPRTYGEVNSYDTASVVNNVSRIIGIKNVTENAGTTTLMYMMMNELSKKYTVKCIEINQDDFKYFQNPNMKSISAETFMNEILLEPYPEVILVDQNNYDNELIIKETIYLLEPSILKFNKAIDKNPNLLTFLQDKKVVYNRAQMPLSKLQEFSQANNLNPFDIIRNVNERDKINPQIINLLTKLGFDRVNNGNIINDDTEKKKSFF